MRSIFLSLLLFILPISILSQVGRGVYRFLDLPVSAHSAAIGGLNVSLPNQDIGFALMNPALLNCETNGVISFNMANYLSDIKFGSAIFGHGIGQNNFLSYGVQYIDYGKFAGYNEFGVYTEDFTAKDMAFYISYARHLNDYFTVGTTLKPIVSVLERYSSYGVAMDFGISYDNELLSAGLVVKNVGAQIKGYYSTDFGDHKEPLPFDIQLGVSKKFEHAPIRFSITANNLNRWDVVNYKSTEKKQTNFDGVITPTKVGFVDMAFRHLIFGVEFVPTNNFYIGAGYNHRRTQEMAMEGFKSLSGFSFGAGIKLYKFNVGFSTTQFQVGNVAYQFSVSTNLNEFVSF